MTLEAYKEKMSDIEVKIRLLSEERKNLKREYIESNSPFEVGEKVIVTYDRIRDVEEVGFIAGYEIFFDKINPLLKACKKDGTMSKNSLSNYRIKDIRKFSE